MTPWALAVAAGAAPADPPSACDALRVLQGLAWGGLDAAGRAEVDRAARGCTPSDPGPPRWASGNPARRGAAWFWPNGNPALTAGGAWLWPDGNVARSEAGTTFWPDGAVACRPGPTSCVTPDGAPSDLAGLVVLVGRWPAGAGPGAGAPPEVTLAWILGAARAAAVTDPP